MAIIGYTFDRAKVSARNDASLYDFLGSKRNCVFDSRGNGMEVTTSGLVCTIATGQAIIQGRLIEITAPEVITIPANSSGYLCITIDLSQINTSSGTPGNIDYTVVLGQLKVEFLETLTQEDLFNGGLIYNLNLGAVTTDTTTASYAKNLGAYTSASILPNGVIYGNSLTSYGSAIADNRWYGSNDNLIIDIPTTKKLIIRDKDTQTVLKNIPTDSSETSLRGIIYGADATNYGSAIVNNRWHAKAQNMQAGSSIDGNLYIEPQYYTASDGSSVQGMAVVRQPDQSSEVLMPIKASKFIGDLDGGLTTEGSKTYAAFGPDTKVTTTATTGWTKISDFVFKHDSGTDPLIFPISFNGAKKYIIKISSSDGNYQNYGALALGAISESGPTQILPVIDFDDSISEQHIATFLIDLEDATSYTGISFTPDDGWRKQLVIESFREIISGNSIDFHINDMNFTSLEDTIFIGNGGDAAHNGTHVTSVGSGALKSVTAGINNVAIGANAAKSLTTASGCVVIGSGAAEKVMSNENTIAIGANAIGNVVVGNNIIAIGTNSGATQQDGTTPLTSADNSIFIGNNSMGYTGKQYNQIVIGNGATGFNSNSVQLGSRSTTSAYFGAGASSNWNTKSDYRIKEEIADANIMTCLNDINRLPLKRFKYKDFVGVSGDIHLTGFLAQDFEDVFPKAVITSDAIFEDNGDQIEIPNCKSINISQIIPTLVGAVQELTKRVAELEEKLNNAI